jgi:hypothetical protein
MGHASVQITLDRCSHLMQDAHPAQAAKLSDFVFGATPWFPKTDTCTLAKGPSELPNSAKDLLTERAGTSRNTVKDDVRRNLKYTSRVAVIVG